MTFTRGSAISLCLAAALGGIAASVGFADDGEQARLTQAQAMFKPLPADARTPERPVTPELVALGRALFFETRVSTDGRQSCAACHQASFYGSDALPMSVGNSGNGPGSAPPWAGTVAGHCASVACGANASAVTRVAIAARRKMKVLRMANPWPEAPPRML